MWEEIDRRRKEREEFERNIPKIVADYIEKGHRVLKSKYHKRWDKIVPARVSDLYRGSELQAALDIIELLDSGDFIGAEKKVQKSGAFQHERSHHSKDSRRLLRQWL